MRNRINNAIEMAILCAIGLFLVCLLVEYVLPANFHKTKLGESFLSWCGALTIFMVLRELFTKEKDK